MQLQKGGLGDLDKGARPRPLALIVLDGWGLSDRVDGNAVKLARTPVMDGLIRRFPFCRLTAHGEAVGLMPGQMGDSNVGHLNLGAGRVVYQDLVRISRSVRTGQFFRNPALLGAVQRVRASGGRLHLMGLLSDGGVHSHQEHLYALMELASKEGVGEVLVHCFTDGRDTPPTSGKGYIEALEAKIRGLGKGRIATVMGRYYAMDRDKRWERTKKAFDAIVHGVGRETSSGLEAIEQAYAMGETDEFVTPTVVTPAARILPGDAVIFFNFRADRARQMSHALVDERFEQFDRGGYAPVYVVGMAQYEEGLDMPVAFPPVYLRRTLGEVLSESGLRQLRIAETEKYAHVTFFFNGQEETPFPGEERLLIPSPKVATYDLKPEMSAFEVTEAVVEGVRSGGYDVIVLNYANADMVGHTGCLDAAVKAIEAVDACLGKVLESIESAGGAAIVCSDHGNAEQMVDYETGEPHTAHTSNPVPCIIVDRRIEAEKSRLRLRDGILADVAPTFLELLGLPKPAEMEGESLIEWRDQSELHN